jgi:hypothetical protein
VVNRCLSACTIIFLSGRERFISKTGVLGFHQPDFPGLTAEERRAAVAVEEMRLQRLGVSQEFARKANTAPPDDMWFPSAAELVGERVVTRVVDPAELAVSAIDPAATADVVQRLLSQEIYVAISRIDPNAYARILEIVRDGMRRGVSVNDLYPRISPILLGLFMQIRPHASERNLLDYAGYTARILAFLNREDSTACYFYLFPRKIDSTVLVRALDKDRALRDEEIRLRTRMFQEHPGPRPPVPAWPDVKSSFEKVQRVLRARFGDKVAIMPLGEHTPDQYAPFCTMVTALYEETLKLPRQEAVPLLRYLFDAARAGAG